ncbi:MAG TPA: GDSL-type esterase/lipase family protein [Pirellulaceae bacterium]|nr:GDSL-type esterase/lipase family protein [Pirellulaceae bacterium]
MAGASAIPLRCRLIGEFPLGAGTSYAWVGGSWIERMQEHDDLELVLTVRWDAANPTFRNLGWGGDTVRGESRAVFGAPDDGYKRLLSDLDIADPDVVLLGYGGNEAFEGAEGKAVFLERYERLIDDMERAGRKVVLVTPPPMEPTGALKDRIASYNLELAAYAIAVVELAQRRKLPVLEITLASLDAMRDSPDATPTADSPQWTLDGQKLTREAYVALGHEIADAVAPDSADVRAKGVETPPGYSATQIEKLQAAIQYKNWLFFQRHRPQNETYLFLFRKHEQGNNAVEIPQFDPLIAEAEREIAELAKPTEAKP